MSSPEASMKIGSMVASVASKSGGTCFHCNKEILKFEKIVTVECISEEFKNPKVLFHRNCFKRHIKTINTEKK